MRPIVPDKPVKFRDPRLNSSTPEDTGGGILDGFVTIASARNQLVTSCLALLYSMSVDSTSNCSRDIRAAQFVIDEQRRRRRPTQVNT